MNFRNLRIVLAAMLVVLLLIPTSASSQKKLKYPSLFWEITGNGLKKPSYLFGTMHISSKLVFHLSDSFYNAIKAVDVVALELNPELWQTDIPRMNRQSEDYQRFASGYSDDYMKEMAYSNEGFEMKIKSLLAREPELNNALLYRTDRESDDFEENTYLDLYIYQTGRKLGKEATGVENYMTSQRMMVEAYMDAALEKNKTVNRRRDVNPYEILQAQQDAYRSGNLDALDSLSALTSESDAFTEKFLYQRNTIQAEAMDSIMKRKSLFVGVGAAHLPGKRGVIEILRKKGYKLRPIFMQDRDAQLKEYIDSLRVPVVFSRQVSEDSFYTVKAPGPLLPLEGTESMRNFADMANGSYYIVSRLRTNRLQNGYSEYRVLRMVDSLLYEAIPGKILSRKNIEKNGYKGFEVHNRTRRGDAQRYQLFVTPQEIILFKMGGTDNYVLGPEADTFFNSLQLQPQNALLNYLHLAPQDGYSVHMPAKPSRFYTRSHDDGQPRLEVEAIDPSNGDTYLLMRKDMYTFNFLEQDTFEAGLMAESFLKSDFFDKTLEKTSGHYGKYASIDLLISTKDKKYVRARCIVKGPHQYLLAVRTADRKKDYSNFFNSLKFENPNFEKAIHIQDTFLKIDVLSPVYLSIDPEIASLLAYMRKSTEKALLQTDNYMDQPEQRKGNFMDETSGEFVIADLTEYPKYYFAKDKEKWWKGQLSRATSDSDMILQRQDIISLPDGTTGYRITLSDTATTRQIKKILMLKGHNYYTIQTTVDSLSPINDFFTSFLQTVKPLGGAVSPSIFDSKVKVFTQDFYSEDTTIRKRAYSALPSMYFGADGLPFLKKALVSLNPANPRYYELREALINEIGYIDDSSVNTKVVQTLKEIYTRGGDTTTIQNAVLLSLSRLMTAPAVDLFKQLLLEDPPVFENEYDYSRLFYSLGDTLPLAKRLYPEILQLAQIQDFKPNIISLLARLVDSGYVKPETYETYLPNIYFDAKIILKKQINEDQQASQVQHKKDNQEEDENDDYDQYSSFSPAYDTSLGILYDYVVLLAPFYDKNSKIPGFLNTVMSSRQLELQARTALLLMEDNRSVPKELWTKLADEKQYRSRVYTLLNRSKNQQLFPAKYASQVALVSGELRAALGSKADTLVLLKKLVKLENGIAGNVYLFKYKKTSDKEWKMVIDGVHPATGVGYNEDPQFYKEEIVLKDRENLDQKIQQEMRKLEVQQHVGGRFFYTDTESRGYNYAPPPPRMNLLFPFGLRHLKT